MSNKTLYISQNNIVLQHMKTVHERAKSNGILICIYHMKNILYEKHVKYQMCIFNIYFIYNNNM